MLSIILISICGINRFIYIYIYIIVQHVITQYIMARFITYVIPPHLTNNIIKRLGTYWTTILKDDSKEGEKKREALQSFIRLSGLSSHMIIACSK